MPSLKLCEEQLGFCLIFYRIGSTIAIKSDPLGGNADTFIPIFPADTLDFLVTDIFQEEGTIHFFW